MIADRPADSLLPRTPDLTDVVKFGDFSVLLPSGHEVVLVRHGSCGRPACSCGLPSWIIYIPKIDCLGAPESWTVSVEMRSIVRAGHTKMHAEGS
jgi:hypothetical protein